MVQEVPGIRVFLLAGGEGSRLFPFTSVTPKPLMPVAGKPIIVRAMERLYTEGFKDFVLCVNEKFADQFRYHADVWESTYGSKVKVSSHEKSEDLGTAGEILTAKQYVDGDFMVYYADILAPNLSLREMVKFFEWHKRETEDLVGTLAVSKGLTVEKGVVEMDGFTVKVLREKPVLNIPNWCGIGVFTPEVLSYMEIGDDFSRNVLPRLLEAGKRITGYLFSESYFDIGSIDAYRKANEAFEKYP